MLRFCDATKSYADGTVALRNVTLDIPRGQFCVVLGASGAGKSTLLRAATGLSPLTSGRVEVDGTPVRRDTLDVVRAKVGMIHQQFGLVGRAAVLGNVLCGALREVPTWRAGLGVFPERFRRKACALLDDLGLSEEHLYRRACDLSGGQQQRVAIARAFILDPAVVLADEPVASLDVAMSETILRLLRDMSAERGTTVLCTLHQLSLARAFADRIVAMRGGCVVADGSPAEVDDQTLGRVYSLAPAASVHSDEDGATAGSPRGHVPASEWRLRHTFGAKAIACAVVVLAVLAFSARRTQIPRLFAYGAEWVGSGLGVERESHIGKGLGRFASSAFPLVIERVTPVSRVEGFDRAHLPALSRVEWREEKTARYDFDQNRIAEKVERKEVLVEPIGYLLEVCSKVLASIEIALWGTLFALALGAPLAYLGARGYTPHRAVYLASRALSSYLRAVPELVSALILVLAFGFGPIAGVVALALHSAGFFGKFYADDIENADHAPQEALIALGANRLKVLRHAVLPQVLPQYVAYTQYILERNVRMATVIGVVGAGGIGVELKGRFDTFDFGHVSTILVVIFATVLVLEQISQALRSRLIRRA